MRLVLRVLSALLGILVALIAIAWACAAVWFDGPASRPAAGALAAAVGLAGVVAMIRLRPWVRAAMALVMLVGVIGLWWSTIDPRNDRDWLSDVSRLPSAELVGQQLTVHNVRNFAYRSETDFTENWETRTYDLTTLQGVDMFLSFWGPTAIAHTIASWDFGDGQHLAISIETRKEKGETYDAVRGFFRQYELYYVVADERDVIGVRTNHRGEEVYLYRIHLPPDRARAILLDYFAEVNALATQPRWYNALTHNCTTTIREHVQHVMPAQPWDWRILANGYIDQLWYERGIIDTDAPFPDVKARSDVTARAKAAGDATDFSTRIRGEVRR